MRGGVRPPRAEPGALSRKTAAAHRASRRADRLATSFRRKATPELPSKRSAAC